MWALQSLTFALVCRVSLGTRHRHMAKDQVTNLSVPSRRLASSSVWLPKRPSVKPEPAVGPVRGLRNGDSWQETETRKLARTELAQCLNPEVEPDMSGPPQWLPPLEAAAKDHSGSGHAQTAWKPLEGFIEPKVGKRIGNFLSDNVVAWHRGAVINSDPDTHLPAEMDYPEARCFQFNYSSSGPDPYGCTPFKKSFSRLQRLRTCINGRLQQSRRWRIYREVGKRIMKTRREKTEWDASSLDSVDATLSEDPEEQERLVSLKASMSENWQSWTIFDANQRADEMVKYIAFKDWTKLSSGLLHLLDRKIRDTITGIELEESVITMIRSDCFQVTVDSYALLPSETKTLRRALPCVPLMWDSVEVGGNPHKPVSNGVTMWDESYRYPPVVKIDLPSTPPVCGRIALGLMKRPLIYAPKAYSPSSCVVGHMDWTKCLSLNHYNCICFEKCWVAALKIACKLADGCCSDYDAVRSYDDVFQLPWK